MTMTSLVFHNAAVRFLFFPRIGKGYVRYNLLIMGKTAETLIQRASKRVPLYNMLMFFGR